MRRIRKVTTYVCTVCFQLFPNGKEARAHASKHPVPKRAPLPRRGKPGRPRVSQVAKIERAIRGGARSARQVQEETRIPLGRVHALLSYLRRRKRISGFGDSLKAL